MTRLISMAGIEVERRVTVGDLIAARGTRRFIQATAVDAEVAAAAEAAGIDMLSIGYDDRLAAIRAAAPTMFLSVALPLTDFASADALMAAAMDALEQGADGIYYCGPLAWIEHLARAGIPVMGHAGLVPRKSHWHGGLRALGKTPDEARAIWRSVRDLERAGAYAVELEVIPAVLTRAITARTSLVTSSIGAGPDADIVYQFSEDILGETPAPPRHARAYDDFSARYRELQQARIAALESFRSDVESGGYPGASELVVVDEETAAACLRAIESDP